MISAQDKFLFQTYMLTYNHTNTNNKCYQSAFKQVFPNYIHTYYTLQKDIWRMEPHNCKSCQMTARNGVKLGPEMKTHSPLAYGSYNDKQGSNSL